MEEGVVKFKLLGRVSVPHVMDPPFHVRLSKAIKEKLGIDYDSSKHAYLFIPPIEERLGAPSTYDIFEKTI